MATYTRLETAERAGVDPDYLDRLVELGIIAPSEPDAFSPGDIRRVLMTRSVDESGISLDGLAAAIRDGSISMAFLDAPAYERFAALAPETFLQVADRTGIPLELLSCIRESIGMASPSPDDRLREDEMAVVPFLELQFAEGFSPAAIDRLIRVYGDSTRRITEEEGAWWQAEVVDRALGAGQGSEDLGWAAMANRTTPLAEQSVLALYHAQQARAWTANLITTFEDVLAKAGLHSRLDRPPAVCFLDITGYTRLTQERGDAAAADLAAAVARMVRRSSIDHGGKPIKWLGDGVMFYFREPASGVASALEMLDGLAAAGLPPAHVGLHAGPVIFQEGDYFGATVNVSARIADYARPGEVLVSREVAGASNGAGIVFDEIGPVELKGVSGSVDLLRARRA